MIQVDSDQVSSKMSAIAIKEHDRPFRVRLSSRQQALLVQRHSLRSVRWARGRPPKLILAGQERQDVFRRTRVRPGGDTYPERTSLASQPDLKRASLYKAAR
ncbi:hypothetical protein H920_11023 [Fukomys damarensis]|uniref:Uncharacterized protein n=1 Tax=Fukomys damarensis TaxID=885580 RepID=A0A091DXB9_FUKDA|nr:hypothetical protein H920_11023 [Fukomys damarensis]